MVGGGVPAPTAGGYIPWLLAVVLAIYLGLSLRS